MTFRYSSLVALGLACGAACLVSPAGAKVTEPDGTVVPIDQTKSHDYTFQPNQFNLDSLGLQNFFDTWEGAGAINAVADAYSQPATFSPLCGLDGSLLLRGGSCGVDFGWYCADTAPGVGGNFQVLISAADMLKYFNDRAQTPGKPPLPSENWGEFFNNDSGFLPTIQMGMLRPLTGSLASIRTNPAYLACAGQKIGFGFMGNPTSFCPQSKWSEQKWNATSTLQGGNNWISVLIYPSKKFPGTFYMAFEDMPHSDTEFSPMLTTLKATYPSMKQPVGWDSGNDGDFNDFVFKVSGIQCSGGGQPCAATDDAGAPLKGVCALGTTECVKQAGQKPGCRSRFKPGPETCDGWDNDCNDVIDDGATCPNPGEICDKGMCIRSCASGEFKCATGKTCVYTGSRAGFCVETACATTECVQGQRCSAGKCIGGCDGVVCPAGMQCLAGACLDPCQGVSCGDNYVCDGGACIPSCACMGCGDPARPACDGKGRCTTAVCKDKVCPAGTTCDQVSGNCSDPCKAVDKASCPDCKVSAEGYVSCGTSTGPGSGATGAGATSGTGGGVHLGAAPGSGNTANGGGVDELGTANNGCGCRLANGASGRGLGALAALALGLAWVSRRRRSQN